MLTVKVRAYIEELEAYRRRNDASFAADPSSPLTPGQQADFQGLVYFEVDPSLRYEPEHERPIRKKARPSATCPAPGRAPGLGGWWWRDTCPAQKLQLLTIPLWIWLIVRGR